VLRNVATKFKILRVHFSDGGNDLVARAPLLPGRVGQVKKAHRRTDLIIWWSCMDDRQCRCGRDD
jgi:hypothetical protein